MQLIDKEIKYKTPSDEIRIYNIADIHKGNIGHDRKRLIQDVNKIKNDPNAYWINGGDSIDAIVHSDTKRFDPMTIAPEFREQYNDMGPAQIASVKADLETIKDKCLGIHEGNHEACFDDKTMILTKNGWRTIEELLNGNTPIIGTEILTFNKYTDKLEYQSINDIYINEYNGEMVEIIGKKIDQLLTPSHRAIYKSSGKGHAVYGDWKVKQAWELNKSDVIPISGKWVGEDCGLSDDEIQLLAWIITEGNIERTKDYSKIMRIRIAQSIKVNENKVNEIDGILNRLNIKSTISINKKKIKVWSINMDACAQINHLSTNFKKIDRKMLDATSEQLTIFLDTLVKGDGTYDKSTGKIKAYYTNDYKLVESIQEIAIKLGKNPSVYLRKGKLSTINGKEYLTKDNYLISFWTHTMYNRPNSKKFIHYTGKIWCPSVDNTFVVIKRNEKISISGNSLRKYHHYDLVNAWCADWRVPYLKAASIIRLRFNRGMHSSVLKILTAHGNIAGRKSGNKVNRLEDLIMMFDADVYMLAHGHKKVMHSTSRLSVPTKGKLDLIEDKKVGFMTGSYLKTYQQGVESYAETALYPPSDLGAVCVIIRPENKELWVEG